MNSVDEIDSSKSTSKPSFRSRVSFRNPSALKASPSSELDSVHARAQEHALQGINDITSPSISTAGLPANSESAVNEIPGFSSTDTQDHGPDIAPNITLDSTDSGNTSDIIPASDPDAILETDLGEYELDQTNTNGRHTDATYTSSPVSVEKFDQSSQNLMPAKPATGFRKLLLSLWLPLDNWVDSAAGYDEGILKAHGTPTDEKRRRNIGRAIVVATLVGSLGWLVKISLSMPMPWGILVGLLISLLYGVLSYSLESFFASNVNPFAPMWSKLLSLTGRAALSGLIAFSAALPWVIMSLKGAINLEMVKITQQEQLAMREGIDKINGVSAMTSRGNALQSELTLWTDALQTLPSSIQSALTSAEQCEARREELTLETPKRIAEINTRLALLAKLEANAKGNVQRLKAASDERRTLGRRTAELSKALSDKRLECSDLRGRADSARNDHLKMAGDQRQSAQMRLAQQRDAEQSAFNQARQDTARADELTKAALSANSAGEFTALVSLLKSQLYAQFIAGLIFMGLFLVDLLPLTLRMFVRPGPYDAAKRTDEAARMMSAEGQLLQLELLHAARVHEIKAEDFKAQIQQEVRPHIRAIALNDLARFVSSRTAKKV